MDDNIKAERWPALGKDDEGLQEELESILEARATGDPYADDGSFARNLISLPPGLRAMAATHFLDISLTMDSITWHFGNFGEPGLVAATEEGLLELGLDDLASCFHEARELMLPIVPEWTDPRDFQDLLKRKGVAQRAKELDENGWKLRDTPSGESVIYAAWIRYTRQHPERVFEP